MKITKEKLMEIIKEEVESTLQEDGHEDVPSAVRAMKTIIEDAGQILQALEGMDGTLPTWWTNKMAVASSKMNSMRDYLLVDSEEALEEEYNHITEAIYDDGTIVEDVEFWDDVLEEAEYQGRKVTLNKPTRVNLSGLVTTAITLDQRQKHAIGPVKSGKRNASLVISVCLFFNV